MQRGVAKNAQIHQIALKYSTQVNVLRSIAVLLTSIASVIEWHDLHIFQTRALKETLCFDG